MATSREAASTADDRSARTAILQATERLIQRESLDELSVAQILEEAGISRATFYFYFASKDDAFLALMSEIIDAVLPEFEALMADPDRRRGPQLRQDLASWLVMGGTRQAVMYNAIQEWPRRPDLQPVYLAGIDRMIEALRCAIDEDRKAGVAVDSVPSAQLAAGLVWVMEYMWYEAVGGTDERVADVAAVTDAVAGTFVSAIYGH